jgi:DNA-binding HxlR family transcriptional regulator
MDCSSAQCPVKKTADIVGRKWTTLIIRDLLSGNKSFSTLQSGLINISPKVLADRLKFLQARDLINRKVFPTNPPTTEYSLTPMGKELKTVIQAMAIFGERL